MARLEDVAFTAASVQQFARMFTVDLFSQSVHVDFDNVRERIKGVVPNMGRDLGARNELARAAREILEQRLFFRSQSHFVVRARHAMARNVDHEIFDFENVGTKM